MRKKCFLCGLTRDLNHFNNQTFENCFLKLLYRKKKNFLYNDVTLTRDSLDDKGFHMTCYKKVTVLNKKYKEDYLNFITTHDFGNQLVIRVSDKNDSKTNVFNRFSVSDGYFENNIIVKEEQEDHQHENEESSEQMEAEEEPKEFSPGEEMFPAVQAVLGDQESGSQDTSKALKELNDTFRKFVSLYSERTQALHERTTLDRERISLDREKLALDRARLQYEMDTIKTKNGSAPKSDS